MTESTLSIVVVTWNSAGVVGGLLNSLRQTLSETPFDLIVVDNGSKDRTVEVVRGIAPDAHVIANPVNRGLAAANNQGMAAATGSMILICNPDVIFQDGAVQAMLEVMHRHTRAGWVVPRLVYEDGTTQTSAGDLPSLMDAVLGRQLRRQWSDGDPRGFWWDHWPHREERPIGRGHEAAYLVRRETVEEVGMQDERYRLDWEGIDWTDRFRRLGWEIWLAPEASVIHLGGASVRQVPYRWILLQHRGMYLYFADRRPFWWRPALSAVLATRAGLKIAVNAIGAPLYEWSHRGRRSPHRAGSDGSGASD